MTWNRVGNGPISGNLRWWFALGGKIMHKESEFRSGVSYFEAAIDYIHSGLDSNSWLQIKMAISSEISKKERETIGEWINAHVCSAYILTWSNTDRHKSKAHYVTAPTSVSTFHALAEHLHLLKTACSLVLKDEGFQLPTLLAERAFKSLAKTTGASLLTLGAHV